MKYKTGQTSHTLRLVRTVILRMIIPHRIENYRNIK
jgi:hypothetical protein